MPDTIIRIQEPPLILGASLGNCVHVAGVANFLRLAQLRGFRTTLLGAAVEPERVVAAIDELKPDLVGVSYRLTPEVGGRVLERFLDLLDERSVRLMFGGTPAMVEIARRSKRFEFLFVGDEPLSMIEGVFRALRGETAPADRSLASGGMLRLGAQLRSLKPMAEGALAVPLIRHHFGLPDLEETIRGVGRIAEAGVLDVISLAPDQNAQQYFFQPERMDPALTGSGGVPLRSPADLRRIREAGQRGNYPRFRVYAGTQDLLQWAQLSVSELDNAWGAIPLFWYSELDGRSRRSLETAIQENREVIRWYAQQGLPIELLEAHQWSLRDAPDPVAIAAAYLGAYNARALGVRDFIAQYMFNTPRFTSPLHDLGKMTAQMMLIDSLRTDAFTTWRQVRPGLSHFAMDPHLAKGQLAAAVMNALGLRPHIIHVVSFSEADHAAGPDEVIESCRIVQGVLKNAVLGLPDYLADQRIAVIREALLGEVAWILGTVDNLGQALGVNDPFADPRTLAMAVRLGILDAPHLRGQPCALGQVETMPVRGGCHAIDRVTRCPLSEHDRLQRVLESESARHLLGRDASALVRKWEVRLENAFGDTMLIGQRKDP